MKNSFATEVLFPFILSLCLSVLCFTILWGRPVTGVVVGAVLGCIIFFVTAIIVGDMRRDELPYEANEEVTSLWRIPYFFFYIWLRFIGIVLAGFLGIALILAAIVGIICVIGLLISKGF